MNHNYRRILFDFLRSICSHSGEIKHVRSCDKEIRPFGMYHVHVVTAF